MTASMPTRPGDLRSAASDELLDAWRAHIRALVFDRHGVDDPLSLDRLAGHALGALACGQALADKMLDSRWITCRDALGYGVPVEQVAGAMGLDVSEVTFGLTHWADGQLREHLMTPVQHAEVVALVDVPAVTR